jgi:membrane protease YdiL (CAAX protease family)
LVLSDVLGSVFSSNQLLLKVLLKIGLFSLLCFLIVPVMLKLPFGENSLIKLISLFSSKSIQFSGLSFIGLSSYLIFVLSQIVGSLIYHIDQSTNYVINFSRHSLFDSVTITSGIFEEIIFRGIILSIFLNRYSEKKAILLSATVFGGIHALNILNPQKEVIWVLAQVIWAVGFGIMYSYIFIKTKSLIPLILLHYLINGMVGVWFYGLDKNDLNSAFYGLPFLGLLPAAIVIIWVRYLIKNKNGKILNTISANT